MWLLLLLLLIGFIPHDIFILGHLNPAAASLLRQLNPAIDPCEDFYGFVCDNYIRNNVIPDDDVVKSWRTDIRDLKVRVLANETETYSISKALRYLNTTGGSWPTFDPTWNENHFDLETSLAAGTLQDGFDTSGTVLGPFIRLTVTRDYYAPRPATLLEFSRPSFLLKTIDLSQENLAEFESLIIDSLRLLGADDNAAETDGKSIFQFEMAMQASLTPFIVEHSGKVSELQANLTYLDWYKYLSGVLKPIGRRVQGDDPMRLRGLTFFKQLGSILASTSKRTIANDIKWRMFQLLLPAMPDSIRKRFLRIETKLTGVKSLPKRLKHCVLTSNSEDEYRHTNYGMGHAVGRLYVQSAFNRFDKYMTEVIGSEVEAIVAATIENSSWLSRDTKNRLKRKLNAMVAEHIYQEATLTDSYLENFYRDVHIKRRGFVENLIKTAQGIVKRNLEELDNPIENRWFIHPAVGTAVYGFFLNLYVVSAQWLYPDGLNFDLRNPMVINYATGGYVSGHELMHGLDGFGKGYQFDEQGKFVGNIYSPESWDAFREREMCIIEQYSEYDVPFTNGTKVSGARTASENVPDNIGVKFPFLAYENYVKRHGEEIFTKFPFTPRQLFFLIYTRKRCEIRRPKSAERRAATGPYSSGQWRANGPLRNFPEFAEHFNCPLGSFMNPVDSDRCIIL